MKVNHQGDYTERRRNEYPDIAEQLDAIWKGGAAEKEMRQRIMAIKKKYPKPSSAQSE